MLPARNRLKIKNNTISGWRDKRQVTTPFFRAIFRLKEGGSQPKIGFIVTGKAGKAATRNKIRRTIIEKVRGLIDGLPPNLEAIFIVSRPIESTDYEKLGDWVHKSLSNFNRTSN